MSESHSSSCHCELCCDSLPDSFTTNILKAPGSGASTCKTDWGEGSTPPKSSLPSHPQNPDPSLPPASSEMVLSSHTLTQQALEMGDWRQEQQVPLTSWLGNPRE